MSRHRIGGLACLFVAFVAFAAPAEDDPIRAKLNISRTAYKVELTRYREAVAAYFDSREQAARDVGNKEQVDQIKAERTAFQEKGDLPLTAPPDLRRKLIAARQDLLSAFQDAVKEYTRAKKDDLAAAVDKELKDFKFDSAPWVPLFNGTSLNGWHTSKGSDTKWEVRKGVLSGTGKKGSLVTDRNDFENFRMRVEAMSGEGIDSGLCLRVQKSGFAYEINLADSRNRQALNTGSIARFQKSQPHIAAQAAEAVPAGKWFSMEVLIDGNSITVWIDGKKSAAWTDKTSSYLRGAISIQAPDSSKSTINLRRIEIKELPAMK